MARAIYPLCLLVGFFLSASAQQPVNDSIANAIELTVNTSAQYDTIKISGATSDFTGCGKSDDIWFKFEMPSSGGIRILTQSVELNHSMFIRLYEGPSSSLTAYACTGTCHYYSGNNCGSSLFLKDPSLFGDTVYIRASTQYNFTTGDSAAIAIVSVAAGDFPTNDSCENAIDLTGKLNGVADTSTFENALVELSLANCAQQEDVWVKFEVPSSGGFDIQTTAINTGHSPMFRAYTGSCASLTSYACTGTCDYYSGNNCGDYLRVINTDIAGDTVWLRLVSRYSSSTRDSFSVLINEIPSAEMQPNDSCQAAIDITANLLSGADTLDFQHAIVETSLASCGVDDDVWVKFEVPTSGGFEMQSYAYQVQHSPTYRMYTGGCASLSAYSCTGNCDYYSSNNCGDYLRVIDTTLKSDTVWVRLSPRYSSNPLDSFIFDITEIPTSSFNTHNICEDAIDMTSDMSLGIDTFSFENAMVETSLTSCGTDDDVWMKFVVPSSGGFEMKTYAINVQHTPTVKLYTGSCASLADYNCTGTCDYYSTSSCSDFTRVVDTSLIGDTVWMRAARRYTSNPLDTFGLSIDSITPNQIISNSICANAKAISANIEFQMDTFDLTYGLATQSANSCGDDELMWFKFEVPANGAFELQTNKITSAHEVILQLWTGDCGSLTKYECDSNCNFLNASNTCSGQMLIRDTSLAGDTVYLMAQARYANGDGTFTLGLRNILDSDLPVNDDCWNAQALSVGNGNCVIDTFHNNNTTYSVVPTGSCGGFNGSDIWYKFEMPTSDDVYIEMAQVGSTAKSFRITAFSGPCSSLTEEDCSASGNYPDLNLRNLALAGDTVYLHVYRSYTSIDTDTFGLCIKDTVLAPLRTEIGQFEHNTNCNVVWGTGWFDMVDDSNLLIMSLDANGAYLGRTCFGVNIEDSTNNLRTALDTNGNTAYLSPRNYYIDPQGAGTGTTVRIYFKERELEIWRDSLNLRGLDVGSSLLDFYSDSIRISKFNGANLDTLAGGAPTHIKPTVSKIRDTIIMMEFTVSSFSNFIPVFNPGNPLIPVPVTWLDFQAKRNEHGAQLNWSTASELNCSYYEVQKSADGVNFTYLDEVPGSGTSHELNTYEYIDAQPNKTRTFYRLKQWDYDGNFSYSKIVQLDGANLTSVLPNPFNHEMNIDAGDAVIMNIEVYDELGRPIYTINEVADNQIIIQTSDWISGIYIVRIDLVNGQEEHRIIKQ
ncbi:MAG: T9SS type A sorting domain-containing protein [Bacteroidia bacterium]